MGNAKHYPLQRASGGRGGQQMSRVEGDTCVAASESMQLLVGKDACQIVPFLMCRHCLHFAPALRAGKGM